MMGESIQQIILIAGSAFEVSYRSGWGGNGILYE